MARITNRPAQQQLAFGEAPRAPAPGARTLLVLPDAARVEEHLLRAAQAKGISRADAVCTVADLERELVQAARGPLRAASPAALELLYRRVAREKTPRGSPWFEVRETAGFAQALRQLAASLGQGALTPQELLDLVDQLDERTRLRLAPLAQLLEAARAALAARGLCDGATALAHALRGLEERPLPRLLQGLAGVRFEAVLDWPPLRLELLFALARRLGRERAQVELALPFWPSRRSLAEEPLGPVLRAIEERGARAQGAVPELILQPLGDDGPLGPFRARLFAATPPERHPPMRASTPVALASCASPAAEAREVARRCADLLDQGAPPDSIAVAVRSLAGGPAEELASALEQLGLPWRERRGRPALASPPAALALSLYELIERDFPREPLAALLGSRLLRLRAPGERTAPEAIARWLRKARVRDDRADGGIAARLLALAARLRHSAEIVPLARTSLEQQAEEVDEARLRCQRVISELRTLPAQATLREHGAALLALLTRWELFARARQPPGAPGAEWLSTAINSGPLARALQAARGRALLGLTALEEVCEALAGAARELGEEQRTVPRESWAELLGWALGQATLPPPGARGAAIELVELRELPGRSFDHLIVAGLLEGQLPARAAIDPLLGDEDKRALQRAARRPIFRAPARGPTDASGADPPSLPARQAEEPLLFQLGLAAARESIALFWPRADGKGREAPRSAFADEAARALGHPPSQGEPLHRPADGLIARLALAAIPALDACRSSDELLARASLDGIADPAFRAFAPAPPEETRALLTALARSPLRPALHLAARASLAERERLSTFVGSRVPGRFSGQLQGAARESVQPLFAFGPEAPLSASQLEDDARCPFRTFGHRVLRLRDEEDAEDELSARERGNLLHRCLEAFYSSQRARGQLPLVGPRAAWAAELRAVALEQIGQFALEQDAGHAGLWRLRREELLALLEEVVAGETELGAAPIALEQTFGVDAEGSWAPLRIPAPAGEQAVFARGAIDRLDADPARPQGLLVIDYKSGAYTKQQRKLRPAALFTPEFQLPLYVAAASAQNPGRAVDALFLALKDAKRTPGLFATLGKAGIALEALTELDPARRARLRQGKNPPPNLADAVWARVSRLRAGALPVQPIDCEHCDLKPVCRIAALPVDEEALA